MPSIGGNGTNPWNDWERTELARGQTTCIKMEEAYEEISDESPEQLAKNLSSDTTGTIIEIVTAAVLIAGFLVWLFLW